VCGAETWLVYHSQEKVICSGNQLPVRFKSKENRKLDMFEHTHAEGRDIYRMNIELS
jgi:hypothetical protein